MSKKLTDNAPISKNIGNKNNNNRYQNFTGKNNLYNEQNVNNNEISKKGSDLMNINNYGKFKAISNANRENNDNIISNIREPGRFGKNHIINIDKTEQPLNINNQNKTNFFNKNDNFNNDNDDDYDNSDEDDFENILRVSKIKQDSTRIIEENPFSTSTNKEINKLGNKTDKNKFKTNNNIKSNTLYNNINEHFNSKDFSQNLDGDDNNIDENLINDDYKKNIDIFKNNFDDNYFEEIEQKNKIYNNYINIINEDNINKNILENEDIKNRLINHNIEIENKLKEINFFERLKSISNSRYSFFVKNFQNDKDFLEPENFDNEVINITNLKIKSPLSLILYLMLNQNSQPNLLKKIFNSEPNSNYRCLINESELNKIPRYFNDLNYVNELYNTFDFDKLNNFLKEINEWENLFKFKQDYTHPIKYFKYKRCVTMENNVTIYFVSPLDLIIDSKSRAIGIPISDTVMALNQIRFHNDIRFDNKIGKFIFETSVRILNSIKIIANISIHDTIKKEGKNENDHILLNTVWSNMEPEILKQDIINQNNVEKIYKKYLQRNIMKYSNKISEEYKEEKKEEEILESFSEKSIDDDGEKNDINKVKDIFKNDLDERNRRILNYGGYGFIAIYALKIFFRPFSVDTIVGLLWISFIIYLMYKFK